MKPRYPKLALGRAITFHITPTEPTSPGDPRLCAELEELADDDGDIIGAGIVHISALFNVWPLPSDSIRPGEYLRTGVSHSTNSLTLLVHPDMSLPDLRRCLLKLLGAVEGGWSGVTSEFEDKLIWTRRAEHDQHDLDYFKTEKLAHARYLATGETTPSYDALMCGDDF